ncbi:hypothetical protein BH20GEM2_BH20GEM2_09100 [soil metagenome]
MKDRPSIMSRLAARRPSPAMIVALMALFASTGGVSYALATGSIGSREIRNSSIQGKDVGKNEITAREIARRSIDGTDVKVNRVGGNAVKEEVLEAEKIGKVSAAVGADTLGGQTAEQIIAAGRAGGSAGSGRSVGSRFARRPRLSAAGDLVGCLAVEAVGVARAGHLAALSLAWPARREPWPGEKGQIRAGRPGAVGVEEMIGVGGILVDRALHEAHSQHAGVEVEVLLRIAGDHGDVMDAVGSGGRVCIGRFRWLAVASGRTRWFLPGPLWARPRWLLGPVAMEVAACLGCRDLAARQAAHLPGV